MPELKCKIPKNVLISRNKYIGGTLVVATIHRTCFNPSELRKDEEEERKRKGRGKKEERKRKGRGKEEERKRHLLTTRTKKL
ncbi:hypothetical protein BpHYR1_023218 [Brachionus plicatilis]|uniref:Uncharacterized protein n=1 Tax=Brachionus plicatilis TaxID=10195 RepID=A0A3M7PJF8_BRAPC|nr:hypothetical protein BpHYR1_023218 [Brachionus plicatilis]